MLLGASNDPGSPFRWWECSVQRADTCGVAARRKLAQEQGAKWAAELKVPEFIAFQDRENQNHTMPYLIAQTVGASNGSCIIKQVTERETIEVETPTDGLQKIRFDPGDYVLQVRWCVAAIWVTLVAYSCARLRRCDEDDEGRTFELDLLVEPTIANSTELRCRAIDMETSGGGPR